MVSTMGMEVQQRHKVGFIGTRLGFYVAVSLILPIF